MRFRGIQNFTQIHNSSRLRAPQAVASNLKFPIVSSSSLQLCSVALARSKMRARCQSSRLGPDFPQEPYRQHATGQESHGSKRSGSLILSAGDHHRHPTCAFNLPFRPSKPPDCLQRTKGPRPFWRLPRDQLMNTVFPTKPPEHTVLLRCGLTWPPGRIRGAAALSGMLTWYPDQR